MACRPGEHTKVTVLYTKVAAAMAAAYLVSTLQQLAQTLGLGLVSRKRGFSLCQLLLAEGGLCRN